MPRAIRDAAFEIGFRRTAKEEAIGARPAVRPAARDVGQFEQARRADTGAGMVDVRFLYLVRRRRRSNPSMLVFLSGGRFFADALSGAWSVCERSR